MTYFRDALSSASICSETSIASAQTFDNFLRSYILSTCSFWRPCARSIEMSTHRHGYFPPVPETSPAFPIFVLDSSASLRPAWSSFPAHLSTLHARHLHRNCQKSLLPETTFSTVRTPQRPPQKPFSS